MKRKVRVKSYVREGYKVSGPINVSAHQREIDVKKASSGSSNKPMMDLSKNPNQNNNFSNIRKFIFKGEEYPNFKIEKNDRGDYLIRYNRVKYKQENPRYSYYFTLTGFGKRSYSIEGNAIVHGKPAKEEKYITPPDEIFVENYNGYTIVKLRNSGRYKKIENKDFNNQFTFSEGTTLNEVKKHIDWGNDVDSTSKEVSIDYNKILTPTNKKKIDDSVKSAIFDGNDRVYIDTSAMASEFSEKLNPKQYSIFDEDKADKVIMAYANDLFNKSKKKKTKKATFSGNGNEYIGWIFNIEGKSPPYKTFSTIQEAKDYFKKNNYEVDWRGLDKNRTTTVKSLNSNKSSKFKKGDIIERISNGTSYKVLEIKYDSQRKKHLVLIDRGSIVGQIYEEEDKFRKKISKSGIGSPKHKDLEKVFSYSLGSNDMILLKRSDNDYLVKFNGKYLPSDIMTEQGGRAYIDGFYKGLSDAKNNVKNSLQLKNGKYFLIKNSLGKLLLRTNEKDVRANFIDGYNRGYNN